MSEEIIYESEPYQGRLTLNYIAIPIILIIIVWLEGWIVKITAIGPVFFAFLFSGAVFAILGMPLIFLIRYIVLARPKLIIYTDSISIGEQTIAFKEIKDIVVDGQIFSRWASSRHEEVVVINLIAGNTFTIIVSRYKNGNLFRSVCEKIQSSISVSKFTITESPYSEVTLNPVAFDELGDENFQKFKPNLLSSISFYYSLLMMVAAVMALVTPIKNTSFRGNLFFSTWFLLMSLAMLLIQRYFLVSDKHLVIKNYFYFWMITIIRIDDIKRIQLLSAGRSRQLVIMTRDNQIHKFTIDPANFSKKADDMLEAVKAYIPEYKNERGKE